MSNDDLIVPDQKIDLQGQAEPIYGHEVGYCKPPKNTRFKKGQSGNPKGRPKQTKYNNFLDDLADELKEKVSVTEGGKKVRMTKQRAFTKQIYAKAMSGHGPSLRLLMNLMGKNPEKLVKREPPEPMESLTLEEAQERYEALLRWDG